MDTEHVVMSTVGSPLVYRVYGNRGPVVVGCNGIGVSTVFFEPFASLLADGFRVVLWDYAGHGRSGDPDDASQVTIVSMAQDLARILDAVGAQEAVVVGHSLGTQVGFEFYRAFPHRVRGLIPTLGTFGHALSNFFNLGSLAVPAGKVAARLLPLGHRIIPLFVSPLMTTRLGRRSLPDRIARLTGMVARDAPELEAYFSHLARVDLRVYAQLLTEAQRHDASDLLSSISVPTLVVGGTHDWFVPLRVVQKLADRIPNAELFILKGGTHAGLFEQAKAYESRVREFLVKRVFA